MKKQVVDYDDGSHRRFYIYRHKMVGEDQVMEYLNGDDWVKDFSQAYLQADHGTAVWMAQNRKKYFHPDSCFTVCIGAVDIAVDPYFALEVVE